MMGTAIQVVSLTSTVLNSTKTIKSSIEAVKWLYKGAVTIQEFFRSKKKKPKKKIKEVDIVNNWVLLREAPD